MRSQIRPDLTLQSKTRNVSDDRIFDKYRQQNETPIGAERKNFAPGRPLLKGRPSQRFIGGSRLCVVINDGFCGPFFLRWGYLSGAIWPIENI